MPEDRRTRSEREDAWRWRLRGAQVPEDFARHKSENRAARHEFGGAIDRLKMNVEFKVDQAPCDWSRLKCSLELDAGERRRQRTEWL